MLKVRAVDFQSETGDAAALYQRGAAHPRRDRDQRVPAARRRSASARAATSPRVQLEQDGERIVEFYKSRGFPVAKVRPEVARDPAASARSVRSAPRPPAATTAKRSVRALLHRRGAPGAGRAHRGSSFAGDAQKEPNATCCAPASSAPARPTPTTRCRRPAAHHQICTSRSGRPYVIATRPGEHLEPGARSDPPHAASSAKVRT